MTSMLLLLFGSMFAVVIVGIPCLVKLVFFWFLTEEIQYHDGLQSRELGQAPILLCAPNS